MRRPDLTRYLNKRLRFKDEDEALTQKGKKMSKH